MFSRRACAWKSGPVSMRTMLLLYARRSEGRVRRLRGSPEGETAEAQTAQLQPSVGTPMEVPLPRKVRVASIVSERCSGDLEAAAGRGLVLWTQLSERAPG